MLTRLSLGLTDDTGENKLLFHKAVKVHLKLQTEMVINPLKLYGLIWQYLSPESVDEVKHHKEYKKFNEEKNPEGLWKAVSSGRNSQSVLDQ